MLSVAVYHSFVKCCTIYWTNLHGVVIRVVDSGRKKRCSFRFLISEFSASGKKWLLGFGRASFMKAEIEGVDLVCNFEGVLSIDIFIDGIIVIVFRISINSTIIVKFIFFIIYILFEYDRVQ